MKFLLKSNCPKNGYMHRVVVKDEDLIPLTKKFSKNTYIKIRGYLMYHSFIVPDTNKKNTVLEFVVKEFL